MKTTGIKIFEAVGRLPDEYVTESDSLRVRADRPEKEKRSRRPAWLTDGVIAAAVCVLIGIVTYVGILTFMSGGFQNWVAGILNSEQTTEEDTTEMLNEPKELYFRSLGDGKCEVMSIGSCNDTSIVIPSVSPDGERVIGICDYAFYGCTDIISVTIPDSVRSIGEYAFCGCTSITDIAIPYGVTSIAAWSFADCSGLTSVTIPDGVVSIGDSAFSFCTSLTDISIPDSVTSIGLSAFYTCTSLTGIAIPDGVTVIGDTALAYCSNLTSITIPDSVTDIGLFAFSGCKNLTDITIPDSVKSIGASAFENCLSLERIVIPESVTNIGGSAFYGCRSLTDITLPDSIKRIENSTFRECSSLERIIIPDGVTGIGDYAFVNCSGIEKITIPDGVMNIGIYAFSDCVYLKEITLPAGITEIKTGVFKGCIRLNTITIPDNVTSIGTYAFRGCSDLKFVFLSESLTEIKLGAFFSCSSLSSIHYEGTAEKWRGIKKGDYWNDETSRYILYCSDFQRPKEVDYLTEEKLNGYSELILHPKDGKTLYVDFGMYAFNRLIGKNSRFNKSGPDEYIGWLFDHNVKSIPVTPIVKFEPGIVNDKSVLPNGWVVLSENGVEFAGGYLIYHAADLIFDASFKPERIENGMVYGNMIDYLNGGGFIPVKFKAPEEKVIFQPDIYDFSISDVSMMPQYTIDELIKLNYYLVIKDVSLVNLKKLPYDGDTYDITEILPDELIYDNRIIVY